MTALAVLLAAGILAQTPAAPPAPPAGGAALQAGDVSVDAGRIAYDLRENRYALDGGVVLRRGEVVLRAGAARFDPATGAVDATGGVLLTDPRRAVAADAVHAVLGGAFEATDVVAFVKDEAVALGDAESVEVARRLGRNRLSFTGGRVAADEDGRIRASGARLTLCDCGLNRAPSWLVRARDADVVAGKRAILRGAVVYVTPRFLGIDRPVPVLPVPYLYVPLGHRQTGLLLPEYRSTQDTGPQLAIPVFVTLGPRADLTLTPTWAPFGNGDGDDASVRGPGAELELRWAPWVGTTGRAQLRWVQDLDGPSGPDGAGDGGARLALTGSHLQRVSDRTRLRADLSLFDDPYQLQRFRNDVLLRSTDYTRSGILAEHRRDDAVIGLDASYLLVMRPALAAEFGRFGTDLPTMHRWPSVGAELLPIRVAGPLRLSARAGASRWAPLSGEAVAPRSATNRLDGRAEVSAPVLAGDALVVEPFVRGAAVQRFTDGQGDAASAWGVGGVAVSTELARTGRVVRHAIAPRVEWRAGSGVEGDAPVAPALDAWDVSPADARFASAIPGAFQQLRLAVSNRVAVGAAEVLQLDVGQDVDLRRGALAELWATGVVSAGPFTARGIARGLAFDGRPGGEPAHRFDSPLDRFTQLQLDGRLGTRRGDFVQAGLISVGPGASGTLVAGVDPLFDLRPAPGDPVAQGTVGGQVVLGGATLGYQALFPARQRTWRSCREGAPDVVIEPFEVQQHSATFGWTSPCRCFRVAAAVHVDRCGKVTPGAIVLELFAPGGSLLGAPVGRAN